MKKLIGVKELAEYLDVKENTIYGWVYTKQIPYYKLGRLVKFDVEEIDRWLEKKKQKIYQYKPLEL